MRRCWGSMVRYHGPGLRARFGVVKSCTIAALLMLLTSPREQPLSSRCYLRPSFKSLGIGTTRGHRRLALGPAVVRRRCLAPQFFGGFMHEFFRCKRVFRKIGD